MASVDPAGYSWLSGSALEVAGCVTVVPDSDPDVVARAFGHDPADLDGGDAATFSEREYEGTLGDNGTEIWVAASGGATMVFEFNGFEGTRSEVLRHAANIAPAEHSATLYWNENVGIYVACARRGKVVASIDLYLEEDELADVPQALRTLARLCLDEEADLLAIGAAMVETYVGVGFTEADLNGSTARPIVPVPRDLEASRSLDPGIPGVQEAVAALSPQQQRALGEWAARAAAREAGLTDEQAVRAALDRFGTGEPVALPPALDGLKRRATAESERLCEQYDADYQYDESCSGALAKEHARLPGRALDALRYTSHPDARAAALGALAYTRWAYACARLDRGARFTKNRWERWLAGFDPAPRVAAFDRALTQLLAADPARWDDLVRLLPEPLSAAELAAAAAKDRRLQDAGAFVTWQTVGADGPAGEPEDDNEIDEHVLALYSELERRDLAVAARGPVAVAVLPPAHPAGFAVILSDGLRIERLPVRTEDGRLSLSFEFTDEVGLDPRSLRGRAHDPHARVACEGPEGAIRLLGGGSTANDLSISRWRVRLATENLPWLKLSYLDGGKAVATETIELA